MITRGVKYSFTSKPWQYAGPGGWYFISMPENFAKEIREAFKNEEEGWGRLKATARIGKTEWKTSVWFDTKHKTYLLPLKAEVRKKEKIETEKAVKTTIWI